MTLPDDRLTLTDDQATVLLDWLEHRRDLPLNEGGGGWRGGFDVLVSTVNYSGRAEPEWCPFERLAMGTAAVYPYKVAIPGTQGFAWQHGGWTGQFKRSEIQAVRVWLPVHDDFPPEIPGERLHPVTT